MAIATKICGVNSPEAMDAAVRSGAAYIGLVFYPPSPRYVTPEKGAALTDTVPPEVARVGVFVDPLDVELDEAISAASLTMVQLHGSEDRERVRAIRNLTNLPVIKAIRIETSADFAVVAAFEAVADWLLFDAKPPKSMAAALPGGNALAFDWNLLHGRNLSRPWMLSGGLTAANVGKALRATGASTVDVSSGVEDAPGMKNPDLIHAFLEGIRNL